MAIWQIGSDGDYATYAAFISGEGQPDPGDIIQFKKGEIFREQISTGYAGTSGNPITYESYGTGALPAINGSDDVIGVSEDWTHLG